MLLTERSLRKLIKTVIIENYRKVLKEEEGNFQLKLGQPAKKNSISFGGGKGSEESYKADTSMEDYDKTDVGEGTDASDFTDDEFEELKEKFIDDTSSGIAQATGYITDDEIESILDHYDFENTNHTHYEAGKNSIDEVDFDNLSPDEQLLYNTMQFMTVAGILTGLSDARVAARKEAQKFRNNLKGLRNAAKLNMQLDQFKQKMINDINDGKGEQKLQDALGFKGPASLEFVVPDLRKEGYYGMARILIKNNHSLNEKMQKEGGFGFTNQNFNSFMSDILLYHSPKAIIKDLIPGAEEQAADFEQILQELFEKVNKLLTTQSVLGRLLQGYFSDKFLRIKNRLTLAGFSAYARLNALKIAMQKTKIEGAAIDPENLLTDEALEMSQVVYSDFLDDKGSLTRYLESRKKFKNKKS
jgi:hypothetical protein